MGLYLKTTTALTLSLNMQMHMSLEALNNIYQFFMFFQKFPLYEFTPYEFTPTAILFFIHQ